MAKYIDADDFMKRIVKKYHCNPSLDGGGNNYGYLRLEIDEQPAADVRPERHGEWITRHEGLPFCSECNYNGLGYIAVDFDYCPNCGAKMDGKDGKSNG